MAAPFLLVAKQAAVALAKKVGKNAAKAQVGKAVSGDGSETSKNVLLAVGAGAVFAVIFIGAVIYGIITALASIVPEEIGTVGHAAPTCESGAFLPGGPSHNDGPVLIGQPGAGDWRGLAGSGSRPPATHWPSISEIPEHQGDILQPWPAGGTHTSPYGYRGGAYPWHQGTDVSFGRGSNTPFRAPADGLVFHTTYDSNSGNSVYVAHNINGNLIVTRQVHFSSNHDAYVRAGDFVQAGDVLGLQGTTGTASTGDHFHFEVRVGPSWGIGRAGFTGLGDSVDPLIWLRNNGAVTVAPGLPGSPSEGSLIGHCVSDDLDLGFNGPWGGHENGHIPLGEMCSPLGRSGHYLRCDASLALEELNAAYSTEFGSDIQFTDTYRSYEAQVRCREEKGPLCATPGTSNHGWGLAVDFASNIDNFGTPQHLWMRANAEDYGWVLPDWARENGSNPEPWHWEYVGVSVDSGEDPAAAKVLAAQLIASNYPEWDSAQQRSCLTQLWERESGWDYRAANPTSNARGIPQAMMTAHFPDYPGGPAAQAFLNNPRTQILWGLNYIDGRYATPCAAWEHWQSRNWY